MVETGEFVFPGMELGFAEEFIPGEGTYEEDGKIFASLTGSVDVDLKERKIAVAPKTSTIPVLKNGDIIVGTIVDVKQQLAIVSIMKLMGEERALPGTLDGTIHISQVKDSYVSELSRELSPGDIVVAKVVNAGRMSIQLTTNGKGLGVIKAFCYNCNLALSRMNNKLKCNTCGRTEERWLSRDYGKGEV
ncbi:MAG: exosome complex RNA-binding protein Csl4 [Candidatus Hydrothermarchaeaceae archaeon]